VSQPEASLAGLGFTGLEAQLYCELLKASPATGYGLAQRVGKAPANVYQALASLARKGVIVIDDDEVRSFVPLPPAEVLGSLQRSFDARRAEAESALAGLFRPPEPDRSYRIKSPERVYEIARRMIGEAREVVLFDLFPEPLATLRDALSAAAARSAMVVGLGYQPEPEGSPIEVVMTVGAGVQANLPGVLIRLAVDARQSLNALLSRDGRQVLHAAWSDSPFLACLQHDGMGCEIRLSALAPDRKQDRFWQLGLLHLAPLGLFELQRAGISSGETTNVAAR
jgi:HTH-type transcriptional regulator, sugar sensing transcriptional regulator